MILETIVVGELEVNCYIVAAPGLNRAVIIDPGADEKSIRRGLLKHKIEAGIVINTHGHYDHIGSDDAFGAPVYVHAADKPMLEDARSNFSALFAAPVSVRSQIRVVNDGDNIGFEGFSLKVLHIPGHTPGGMALLMEESGIIFTGDSLFYHSVGRTDLAGGDQDALIAAIRDKIMTLPDATVVYPGHGRATTVGEERLHNPFLNAG